LRGVRARFWTLEVALAALRAKDFPRSIYHTRLDSCWISFSRGSKAPHDEVTGEDPVVLG
jgi:hypothetical protein